jgi:hypothetical protein
MDWFRLERADCYKAENNETCMTKLDKLKGNRSFQTLEIDWRKWSIKTEPFNAS